MLNVDLLSATKKKSLPWAKILTMGAVFLVVGVTLLLNQRDTQPNEISISGSLSTTNDLDRQSLAQSHLGDSQYHHKDTSPHIPNVHSPAESTADVSCFVSPPNVFFGFTAATVSGSGSATRITECNPQGTTPTEMIVEEHGEPPDSPVVNTTTHIAHTQYSNFWYRLTKPLPTQGARGMTVVISFHMGVRSCAGCFTKLVSTNKWSLQMTTRDVSPKQSVVFAFLVQGGIAAWTTYTLTFLQGLIGGSDVITAGFTWDAVSGNTQLFIMAAGMNDLFHGRASVGVVLTDTVFVGEDRRHPDFANPSGVGDRLEIHRLAIWDRVISSVERNALVNPQCALACQALPPSPSPSPITPPPTPPPTEESCSLLNPPTPTHLFGFDAMTVSGSNENTRIDECVLGSTPLYMTVTRSSYTNVPVTSPVDTVNHIAFTSSEYFYVLSEPMPSSSAMGMSVFMKFEILSPKQYVGGQTTLLLDTDKWALDIEYLDDTVNPFFIGEELRQWAFRFTNTHGVSAEIIMTPSGVMSVGATWDKAAEKTTIYVSGWKATGSASRTFDLSSAVSIGRDDSARFTSAKSLAIHRIAWFDRVVSETEAEAFVDGNMGCFTVCQGTNNGTPTMSPMISPTNNPTNHPTRVPSKIPTTGSPSRQPTMSPTRIPLPPGLAWVKTTAEKATCESVCVTAHNETGAPVFSGDYYVTAKFAVCGVADGSGNIRTGWELHNSVWKGECYVSEDVASHTHRKHGLFECLCHGPSWNADAHWVSPPAVSCTSVCASVGSVPIRSGTSQSGNQLDVCSAVYANRVEDGWRAGYSKGAGCVSAYGQWSHTETANMKCLCA